MCLFKPIQTYYISDSILYNSSFLYLSVIYAYFDENRYVRGLCYHIYNLAKVSINTCHTFTCIYFYGCRFVCLCWHRNHPERAHRDARVTFLFYVSFITWWCAHFGTNDREIFITLRYCYELCCAHILCAFLCLTGTSSPATSTSSSQCDGSLHTAKRGEYKEIYLL